MALYNFGELASMTVGQLRALVRKHNLYVALKGYSKMKKTPLIHAFLAKKPAKPKPVKAPRPEHHHRHRKNPQAVSRIKAAPDTPRPKPKRRVAPTLISSATGSRARAPMRSAGTKGVATFQSAIDNIGRNASASDKSKRGKKLGCFTVFFLVIEALSNFKFAGS